VAKRRKSAEVLEEAPPQAAPEKRREPGITEEEMFQPGRVWYVVHTYSGYEDKVRTNVEHRIKSMDAEDLVFHVIVPSVDEIEIRDGQRRTEIHVAETEDDPWLLAREHPADRLDELVLGQIHVVPSTSSAGHLRGRGKPQLASVD